MMALYNQRLEQLSHSSLGVPKKRTGVVIVVMPIIALIQENFKASTKLGISCLQIHSGDRGSIANEVGHNKENSSEHTLNMSSGRLSFFKHNDHDNVENNQLHQDVLDLKYKLIYICPERLGRSSTVGGTSFTQVLQTLYERDELDCFVLDEVHCVK